MQKAQVRRLQAAAKRAERAARDKAILRQRRALAPIVRQLLEEVRPLMRQFDKDPQDRRKRWSATQARRNGVLDALAPILAKASHAITCSIYENVAKTRREAYLRGIRTVTGTVNCLGGETVASHNPALVAVQPVRAIVQGREVDVLPMGTYIESRLSSDRADDQHPTSIGDSRGAVRAPAIVVLGEDEFELGEDAPLAGEPPDPIEDGRRQVARVLALDAQGKLYVLDAPKLLESFDREAFDPNQARDERGRWVDQGGDQGMQAYSPNVKDDSTYDDAVRDLKSPGFERALGRMAAIDAEAGLPTHQTKAIGDWKDGAESSILAETRGKTDWMTLRYSAALKGKELNQKSVAVFQAKRGGPDRWYELQVPEGNAERVRQVLADKGIEFRTLIEHGGGYRVVIIDPGNSLKANVGEVAKHYGIKAKSIEGRAEFIGADTREAAHKAYDRIIDYVERRRERRLVAGGRDGGDGGERLPVDWGREGGRQEELIEAFDEEKHPRGQTLSGTNAGSFAPAEGGAETGAHELRVATELPRRTGSPVVENFTQDEVTGLHSSIDDPPAVREKFNAFIDDVLTRLPDTEIALAVSADGQEVVRKRGDQNSVRFSPEELAKLREAHASFIHNHPNGSSLSPQDVAMASRLNLPDARAVGVNNRGEAWLYTMRPAPGKSWPSPATVIAIFEAQRTKQFVAWDRHVFDDESDRTPDRSIDADDANNYEIHEVWRAVAAKLGMEYERVFLGHNYAASRSVTYGDPIVQRLLRNVKPTQETDRPEPLPTGEQPDGGWVLDKGFVPSWKRREKSDEPSPRR